MKPAATHIDRLARVGLLSSLALVLSYLETMVPLPVALPGVKLGLANVAVVVALFALDWKCAAAVATAKVVASGLLFGSPVMLAYSLGGMALAFASMLALRAIPGVGVVAVSMVSAVAHNAGQLAVAAWMLHAPSVIVNLAPLSVAALVTGSLTGAVAGQALAAVSGTAKRGRTYGTGRSSGAGRWRVSDAGPSKAPRGEGNLLRGWGASHSGRSARESAADVRVGSGPTAPSSQFSSGTLGVYRPGASFAHTLDPRAKVVFSLAYLVAAFLASGWVGMAAIAIVAVAAHASSGAGLREACRALRPFSWLLAFILVFDCLFVDLGQVWWRFGVVCVSAGGVAFAAQSCVRFACMLLATSALMATTSPTALTDAFAKLLSPLRALGVRVDDAALVTGLTLRFIPTFAEELGRIRTAQISRAADFDSGSWARRVRMLVTIATPLVAGALRRSTTLAASIAARAYGAASQRTCSRSYKMSTRDWATVAFSLVLVAMCAVG